MKTRTFTRIYCILFFVFITMQLRAQQTDNLLQVQGDAILFTTPEIMKIDIPVEVINTNYEVCSTELTATFEALRKALIANGIPEKEIRTEDMSVREKYNWDDRTKVFEGYLGSIGIVIELPYSVDQLNALLSTLQNEKFKFGYRLNFKLSEAQKQELREKVITEAIADARRKAETITRGMDIELGAIKKINYGFVRSFADDLIEEEEVFFIADRDATMNDMPPLRSLLNPYRLEIRKSIGVVWHIVQD